MMVPTGEMPIAERFQAIQRWPPRPAAAAAGRRCRRWPPSRRAADVVVTRLARQQAQTIDFATSNVKAAPIPVYIAGAQLLENYPIGPLAAWRST